MSGRDAQALVTALVESHGGQLRRFLAARLRNTADLPDIMQEVYLRMLRIPNVESIRSPEAYLFTVAQHVLQQHALRQSATPPSIELSRMLASSATASDDPVLDLYALQCLEHMQAALDRLSPRARITFLLHRRDGLSLDEIAAHLGTSRAMVKKYLMLGLMQLRQAVEAAE
jgi:RNA polymerase sigma factor (sigma-70 family)